MIENFGSIWNTFKQPNTILLVTTNNVVGPSGLVMGAGIALEARQRLNRLPYIMSPYGDQDYLLKVFPKEQIGCLQTKRDYRDKSPLDLIKRSIDLLNDFATLTPHIIWNLPRPGCGMGSLDWEKQVKPICLTLPDNCIIWSK